LNLEGPHPQDRTRRINHLNMFVEKLDMLYPDHILAIGLYGSMARNQDGPYSDIELFCIVNIAGVDTTFEWIYGDGKAEINVYGLDVARKQAWGVTEKWALSQGQFVYARCIAGSAEILEELKELALTPSLGAIEQIIRDMIVEDLYEWIGKLRNIVEAGKENGIAPLACHFAETTALLLGLANRKIYTTAMSMLAESLYLPDLPDGYEHLCNLVLSGELENIEKVRQTLEAVWAGLIEWAVRREINIHTLPWSD
jgi:kanamycin nucleotidyltransferase